MEQNNLNIDMAAYQNASKLYGKKIKAVPKPPRNIGVDTDNNFYKNIINAGLSSQLDISSIESLTQVSNNRETVMKLFDTMAEDSTIAAALEIYAEDATEPNDDGDIIWCVSDIPEVSKYITYLLDTMNVNKHMYSWVYSLCKYGDLYLRLYRESEYEDTLFEDEKPKKELNENVIVKAYSKLDRYSHYVEMVPNPAEMFELRRMGKTYGYVKANINSQIKSNDSLYQTSYRYSFKKQDVEVYDATEFVHAALEDNSSRVPEEIQIFLDKDYNSDGSYGLGTTYTVNRGQSLLYNIYKIWRMMNLLENAMLLNRLTKSSIVRIIGVEVGDMPKENVGPHLLGIKQLLEQKASINVGSGMSEYNNPGPVENNIYVPTHNGIGAINPQQLGGDTNVTGLGDIDYFKTKLYSSLRIPKQYLGDTDDAAGFNGGSALSLMSSRYAKAVKRIQNSIIQALTNAINLMLLDKGLDSYVNKFTLKMQNPTTQEEKDRKEAEGNKINMISDIMGLIDGTEIENASSKLRILKALLSNVISDQDIIQIINDEIANMERLEQQGEDTTDDELRAENGVDDISMDMDFGGDGGAIGGFDNEPSMNSQSFDMQSNLQNNDLPSPEALDIGDLSDMNNENI